MTKLAFIITLALIPITLFPVGRTALPEGFREPSNTKPVEALKSPSYATYEPLSKVPINAQDYVQAEAAKYGWADGAEWSALVTLVNNESGWRSDVVNSIGACGLFQALPCSKLGAPLDNVSNQARWGLGYIRDRYGNPSNALATWYSRCGSPQGCWY